MKKLGLSKEYGTRSGSLSVIDMAGSDLNVGKDRFPTITATRGQRTPYFVPALGRMADVQEMCRCQGTWSQVHESMSQSQLQFVWSNFNLIEPTSSKLPGMDDRLLAAISKAGIRSSVIGHAIGNAMTVSLLERLLLRLLWSLGFFERLPADRWHLAQIEALRASSGYSGYWRGVQARSKMNVKR